MAQTPECIAYLNAKKNYVGRLNTVIATQPNLWDDMIQNNFDSVNKHISRGLIHALAETSKNLEQLFFSGISETDRINIASKILQPTNHDAYVRTSGFEFLLIRKYDLPFIREFLRLTLIRTGHLNRPGFDGLKNRDLFDKILTIGDKPLIGEIKDKDKFVLHSGVVVGKGRRAQHCPLIVSLVRLMIEYNIPFDSRRPVVQHCLHQQETATEVDFETVPDDDEYSNVVPKSSTMAAQIASTDMEAQFAAVQAPPWKRKVDRTNGRVYYHNPETNQTFWLPKGWRESVDPIWVRDNTGSVHYNPALSQPAIVVDDEPLPPIVVDVENDVEENDDVSPVAAPSAALSPQDKFKNPNLSAINVIGGITTDITQSLGFGGRRTKKCKLSNRMKKRVTRNRKQKKTRKSLRKHKH